MSTTGILRVRVKHPLLQVIGVGEKFAFSLVIMARREHGMPAINESFFNILPIHVIGSCSDLLHYCIKTLNQEDCP